MVTELQGWTCSNCGAWVAINNVHVCPTRQTYTSGPLYATQFDWSHITKLLEQIAEDLRFIKNRL